MFLFDHFGKRIPDKIKEEHEAMKYLLDQNSSEEKIIRRVERRTGLSHINIFNMKEMNLDDNFFQKEKVLFADDSRGGIVVLITDDIRNDIEKKSRIEAYVTSTYGLNIIKGYQFIFTFEFDYIVGKLRKDGFIKPFKISEILLDDLNEEETLDKLLPNDFERFYTEILERGLRYDASDIHIEPKKDKLVVRYRVNGELGKNYVLRMPLSNTTRLLNLFMQRAELDINEYKEGQNGRISDMEYDGRTFSFRISVQPIIVGDDNSLKIVIRILEKGGRVTTLGDLGFSEENQQKLESIVGEPDGIILVTGPTGSGKSTSLHSMLTLLDSNTKNIHTIEDPVEKTIDGINQTDIQDSGVGFDVHLTNLLRQDPDVIMVGEIRDGTTADLAVRGAMTGHLILSTLHTNNAYDSVQRLKNLGVSGDNLASSFRAAIGQRLVKKLCSECKEVSPITEDEKIYVKRVKEEFDILDRIKIEDFDTVCHAKGCFQCNYTGYQGRTVISEILIINDDLRERIYQGQNLSLRYLKDQGFVPKEIDALEHCKGENATVDINEIKRVCGRLGT